MPDVYGSSVARYLGGSQQSVSPGTGKVSGVFTASSTPKKTLVLDPGLFIDDWSAATMPATGGIAVLQGSGSGLLDISNTQTAAALRSGQTVLQPSAVPTAANQTQWTDLLFRQIVFDLSQIGAANRSMFFGSGNKRLWFDRCSILNATTQMAVAVGEVGIDHFRSTTSSDPPANTVAGSFLPLNLYANDYVCDGALTESGATSPFGVNIFGTSTTGLTYGDWEFYGCRFFPGGVNSSDAAIDAEFGKATAGPRIKIIGGEMWNSKIYDVHCPRLYIGGGFLHRVVAGVTSIAGAGMIIDATTTGTQDFGVIEVDGALSWFDDDSAPPGGPSSIHLSNFLYGQRISLKNYGLIVNGSNTHGGAESNIPIYVVAGATASGNFLDDFSADGVSVGYTANPTITTGNYAGVVKVGAQATATCQRINIKGDGIKMLGTQSAAGGLPACVSPSNVGNFLLLGFTGKSPAFTDTYLDGLDTQLVAFATPTGAIPILMTKVGTPTFSKFFYGPHNRPGLQNILLAQSGPLAAPNVLNYNPPADGTFEVGFYLNMVSWTTPAASKVNVTYKDEAGTSRTLDIIPRTIGAVDSVTGVTATGAWYGRPTQIRAQGGTAIQFATTVLTGTPSYDIVPTIRQVIE